MTSREYAFAELSPDVVEQLRATERRLSEQSGETITLIAYRSSGDETAVEHAVEAGESQG